MTRITLVYLILSSFGKSNLIQGQMDGGHIHLNSGIEDDKVCDAQQGMLVTA